MDDIPNNHTRAGVNAVSAAVMGVGIVELLGNSVATEDVAFTVRGYGVLVANLKILISVPAAAD